MRNEEYAAFTELRSTLRANLARRVALLWRDPEPYRYGGVHDALELLCELPYSHGPQDELERAVRAAHRAGADPCCCGKVRCGTLEIVLPDASRWSPPKPKPRRRPSTAVLEPVAAPNAATVHHDASLIEPTAILEGRFEDTGLDLLFAGGANLAERCMDRATIASLRWARHHDTDLEWLQEDLGRLLDARGAKSLRRSEAWLRVGQHARFASLHTPPAPFAVAGAELDGRVVLWWQAPEPVALLGRTGTWVATFASAGHVLDARIAEHDTLEHAAELGRERHGAEFLGVLCPTAAYTTIAHPDSRIEKVRNPLWAALNSNLETPPRQRLTRPAA